MRLFSNLLRSVPKAQPARDLSLTLPREQVHVLDRILTVLAKPAAALEPARILVHRMSLQEAWFRSFQPLALGEPMQFDILLDCRSGVRTVPGRVVELRPVPGGYAGRLQMSPGAVEAKDLELWLHKRSRTLTADPTVRADQPAPWALVS